MALYDEIGEGYTRESGEWDRRHGDLRALRELDLGYRLVVAGG